MLSTSNDPTNIGIKLRFHRNQKGWSQEQLSEKSGVTIRTIQRIENAKVEPHQQTIALLAAALEVDLRQLPIRESLEGNQPTSAEKRWLLILHFSPIIGFIFPFANLIAPIILWVYKRDNHPLYDLHGRAVVNFQVTVTILFMVGVVLLLVYFYLGILLLVLATGYSLALIVANCLRVTKKEDFNYPLSVLII